MCLSVRQTQIHFAVRARVQNVALATQECTQAWLRAAKVSMHKLFDVGSGLRNTVSPTAHRQTRY